MRYWAIQFDTKKPMLSHNKVRIIGPILNFRSPQSRAAWCRKAPKGQTRMKISEESFEVTWALKGQPKNRAWRFSKEAQVPKDRQRKTLFPILQKR